MASLWQDRTHGEDHDWLSRPSQPPRPPRRLPTDPQPPAPPPKKHYFRKALTVTAVLAALGGATAIGTQISNDDKPKSRAATVLPANGGGLASTRINEIYDTTSESVVSIQVRSGSRAASGTGFVIDSDGTIVTNAHVVDAATQAQVRFDDTANPVAAEVLGVDRSSDLAVLKVDPKRAGGDLKPLALADSNKVKVGDAAVAIGFPLGLDKTATAGIISGTGREIRAPNGYTIDEVIQTDAPINPGNSGGPLIDARGRVVGVNSQIATAGSQGGSVGIGFAVPSNTVREVVPRLKLGQAIVRPWLGVSTQPAAEGRGAQVGEVTRGGPAEQAGIQPSTRPDGSGGDVILEIDGKKVEDPDDVAEAIDKRQPGDTVSVKVRRNGQTHDLQVTLGTRPERTGSP